MSVIQNRYEFVMLFDVENGNPNGDPDAGNMPRIDTESNLGIVTDVCLKRKVRNFVELFKEGEPKYNILIKPDRALNTKFTEAHNEIKAQNNGQSDAVTARNFMCENYYDVRTFGAVMSTGDDPCGIVRGPVQFSFAKSIDPVFPLDITITRQAKTTEDRQKAAGTSEMGRKSIVPYGLYRAEGYVSALLAQKVTGFNEEDLELLWMGILNMFEHDRSAARGKMALRKLIVFKHSSSLGNASASELFDKVQVSKRAGVEVPRQFGDYEVAVDSHMPEGVELLVKR